VGAVSDGVFTVSKASLPFIGGLLHTPATLVFSTQPAAARTPVDNGNDDGDDAAVLVVQVAASPAGWNWDSSFPFMGGWPFSELPLSDALLVFSSADGVYPWGGDDGLSVTGGARQNLSASVALPAFVTPGLLVVNETPAQVMAACARVPGAIAQFHGDESPEQCLASTGGGERSFLRAARIPLGDAAVQFDLVEYAHRYSHAQAILLDAHVEGFGGGGKAFNWSLLPTNVASHLVLSGGLTPANVTDGIVQVRPRCISLAVDVSSGVEMTGADGKAIKGTKDAEKIQQFVAAVRAADTLLAKNPFHV